MELYKCYNFILLCFALTYNNDTNMTLYNTLNVKFSNSQLNKLKSGKITVLT